MIITQPAGARIATATTLSAMAIFLAVAQSQAQEKLPYDVGFENIDGFVIGDLDDQRGWATDRGTAVVQEKAGREKSRGLVLEPSDPFGQVSLSLARPLGDVVYSDFWIKPVAGDDETRQFADAEGSITGFFKIEGTGELQVLDGDGKGAGKWKQTGVTLPIRKKTGEAKEWIRITLRQDFAKKTWSIYVDGKSVENGENLGLWDAGSEYLGKFSLMGYTEFPLVFDDLKIAAQSTRLKDEDGDGVPDELTANAKKKRENEDSLAAIEQKLGIAGNALGSGGGVSIALLNVTAGQAYAKLQDEIVGDMGFEVPRISGRDVRTAAMLVDGRALAAPLWKRLAKVSRLHVHGVLRKSVPSWEHDVPWNPLEASIDKGLPLTNEQLRVLFDFGLGKDEDGDGLTDLHEIQIVGNATGANPDDDLDGDGYSNKAEVVAGSDPKDAKSTPRTRAAAEAGDEEDQFEVYTRAEPEHGERKRVRKILGGTSERKRPEREPSTLPNNENDQPKNRD